MNPGKEARITGNVKKDGRGRGQKTAKPFSPKLFSMLIEKARGDRTLKAFSRDAGISYVQLRKLASAQQVNPPGRTLIRKLADNSAGGVEYEDYLFAAGLLASDDEAESLSPREKLLLDKFGRLPAGGKKTVEEFLDFLLR